MRHRTRIIDTSTTAGLRRQLDRVIFVALVTMSLTRNSASQDAVSRQHEVVPSAWLTVAPDHLDPHAPDSSRAFVFPSLDPGLSTVALPQITLNPISGNKRNHFHDPQFSWPHSATPAEAIVLKLTRSGDQLTINVDGDSMGRIRMLRWEEFHRLQIAFSKFLLHHSGCWWFEDCTDRFSGIFFSDLTKFWKDSVLADAAFARFADNSLNDSARRNFEVTYAPDPGKGIPALKGKIEMHATEIGAGEELSITWGATAVFPTVTSGITSGNVRPTMGGVSELQIYGGTGLQLLPPKAVPMTPLNDDSGTQAAGNTVPFPTEWSGLMSGDIKAGTFPLFLPVNTLLDLHDSRLLKPRAAGKDLPAHMFLVTPEGYIKSDAGPGTSGIAAYVTDARGAEATKATAVAQFERRFLLIGCDSGAPACAENEIMGLLDQTYFTTPDLPGAGNDPKDTKGLADPAFTIGVFTNDTVIELRHHVSWNGRPLEKTVPDGETWGTALASWMLSSVGHVSSPRSHPLLEVRRTLRIGDEAQTRQFLFYTTNLTVLNEAQVFEGDEFYGRSDVPALPR